MIGHDGDQRPSVKTRLAEASDDLPQHPVRVLKLEEQSLQTLNRETGGSRPFIPEKPE